MNLLVTGSRTFTDRDLVYRTRGVTFGIADRAEGPDMSWVVVSRVPA